ncbi:1679_t:CDS:2 [Paraglomus brasilianum]|uniref:1679_t:CDS:1 n=1 Tax=Paraglomus brasilianum TaxID=144538 RepID=A0A9N9A6U4_9GLOM|nr:1679_t:CDS:2 [Paraglomus brasilianum]
MPDITVTVKCANDTKYSVTIDTSKTVLDFKKAIAENCDTPPERQRLIYSGRVLKDTDNLETYKIADGHTVHMVRGAPPGGSSSSQQSSNNNSSQQQSAPPPQNAQPMFNPFANLGAPFGTPPFTNTTAPSATGAPLPFGDLFNNPAFLQQLTQMMSDPAVLDAVIASNPQLADMGSQVRAAMQNPALQSMMANPDFIRRMTEMYATMMTPPTDFANVMGGLGTQGAPGANPGFNASANTGTTNTPSDSTNAASTNTTNTSNPTAAPNPFLNLFNPAERYQVQLQQLNEMGFWDAQRNIRALLACGGNVNAAIEYLLSDRQ